MAAAAEVSYLHKRGRKLECLSLDTIGFHMMSIT